MSSVVLDPAYLPFKLDLIGQRVLWLKLDGGARSAASFLDERAIPAGTEGFWAPLATLASNATPGVQPAAHAIFHIGHCGSTLLSRLLDSWSEVEGLREPLPLRTLAEAWNSMGTAYSRLSAEAAHALLAQCWMRWSQPLSPGARCIVKATSSCNALIAPLLNTQPDMRAVLLDVPLAEYLAVLFKADTSVFDAANAAPGRLEWLHARGLFSEVTLHSLSLPAQCAMGWLAERHRFAALATGANGSRVLRIDFSELLANPGATLGRIAGHFGLAESGLAPALNSPAWNRYSKAPSHAYSAQDRAHDLRLASQQRSSEMTQALRWVDGALKAHPELEPLLTGSRAVGQVSAH